MLAQREVRESSQQQSGQEDPPGSAQRSTACEWVHECRGRRTESRREAGEYRSLLEPEACETGLVKAPQHDTESIGTKRVLPAYA
jgi:hypothetical protein